MLKLAMEENDYLTKFWKTIKTEERKIQVRKFIRFANVMFDVVSIKFSIVFSLVVNPYNKLKTIHFITEFEGKEYQNWCFFKS